MRIWLPLLTSGLLLLPLAVQAETSVSVSVGSGECDSSYRSEFYWGDQVLWGDWQTNRGFFVDVNGSNWGGSYSSSGYGNHPNDRGGYRAFIPRGLEGPPQYYGGGRSPIRSTPRYQPRDCYSQSYPGYHCNGYGCNSYGCACGGYLTVVPGYGYGFPGASCYSPTPGVTYCQNPPLWTAPAVPEYGYYGGYNTRSYDRAPIVFDGGGYASDYSESIDFPERPVVYNDNRTYNYYDSAAPVAGAPAPAAPAPVYSEPTEPSAEAVAPAATRSFAARFYDSTRFETPDGSWRCSLNGSELSIEPEGGKSKVISGTIEPSLGILAAWQPGVGVSLIAREGSQFVALYPTTEGAWHEPLPYSVDWSRDHSVGLVAGEPWVTFYAQDDVRYVVAWRARRWVEIGSATSG